MHHYRVKHHYGVGGAMNCKECNAPFVLGGEAGTDGD